MLGALFRRPAPAPVEARSWSLGQLGGLVRYFADIGAAANLTIDEALTHAATSACVDVLASSAAALPLHGIRVVGDRHVPISPTPALLAAPSATVDPDVWVYQLVDSLLTDGNAFGMVAATKGGWPTQVELVDAGSVTDRRIERGVPTVTYAGVSHHVYPYGDLVHIPGRLVRAGSPYAHSPLRRARETIAAALHARRFGLQFFTDGGHPATVLSVDGPDLSDTQARAIKDSFMQATRGNREPAVFGSGITHSQVSVNPNDSQFLDLMRFAIEEACRFFRVPPTMVFAATSGQNVTYANVSQADLQYLKHSLDGYLVRIERKLTLLLPRPQIARFNRGALLRADAETRWRIYDRRLRNRTISVNEVRRLEDEAPIDDPAYDEPGIPGVPISAGQDKDTDGPAAD